MGEINPPLALQGGAIFHDAVLFRRSIGGLIIPDIGEGVARMNAGNDLKVNQNSPAGMAVLINRGGAYVQGDNATDQGHYFVYNDGDRVLTVPAADLANPRKDIVVARVKDNFYGVAGDTWELAVIAGTPAGSPAEPSVPSTALRLATIDVPANASSIVTGNITDRRKTLTAVSGVFPCTSSTRPATAWLGMTIFETDTGKLLVWNGSWVIPAAASTAPAGVLGFAKVTANQTGIGSSVTDLTGLAVTVTVGSSRRIQVTGHGTIQPRTSTGLIIGSIFEGSTELDRWLVSQSVVAEGFDMGEASAILTPSAGSHTYKLTLQKLTGGNTVDFVANATAPAYILVEDIGSA